MLTDPPLDALDLLVIGGLTIDRSADGSAAPGGSVLHIARAAAPRGLRLGVLTAAGPEPEATAGVAELGALCVSVRADRRESTATFQHRESADGRLLWLEQRGGTVMVGRSDHNRITTGAVLFAPVAGELAANTLQGWDGASSRGAILQGWLRSTTEGAEVEPLPISRLARPLLDGLGQLDVRVASREDLIAEAVMPNDQLAALRDAIGPAPALIVTDGPNGLWLDSGDSPPGTDRALHQPVPWRVDTSATVGAGDILAAFLTLRADEPSGSWSARAAKAMRIVAEVLEARNRR
jgi:sugar/nucleoside kinase (ribokinase family)